ncbi:enolase C-terminal domain-like protein [Streptomyces millisiae]|uniref:Enolase C-terminal domain-like protein n=1 Tax=Streptomyces millisiae TaxID=3075542 RepID=A0ABU2LLT2_9ACTN|nr:enolase C-terminal domain-like protein [Streptomyces sp. DSM 44918]MDT0318555.1 enolase C-terminal domain-like protein [Streptomyces sp. DSM 44918]
MTGPVTAGTRAAQTSASMVRAVRAWRLPAQREGLPGGLPQEIAAAAVAPAGPAWAEHRERFALELVGEGASGWHAPLSGPVWQVIADDLAAGLIGHDAGAPRRLVHRPATGRHRSGAHARAAASAVELACWDLASTASGRAVVDLLGGRVRSRVPAYASALGLDPGHPAAPAAASWIAEAGFWGQKWPLTKELIDAGPKAVARLLGALREASGESRFMVDGLGRARLDEAMRLLPVLAELQVAFAEELVAPGSWGWHRLRAAHWPVPMAAGEHAVDEAEQVRLLAREAVDVWQTDPGWSGGLARSLHTTDLARSLGIPTLPHGAHLPAALALAAVCCRDMVPAVEYHLTVEPLRQQIYTTPLAVTAGHLPVRTTLGLAGPLARVDAGPVWEVTGA